MKRKRTPIRDHKAESDLFFRRAVVAFGGILVLIGMLLLNLYNIQITDHQDYITRSNDNRIKIVPVAPNRGLIFDRNGKMLAENRPVYALEITPEKVKDIPAEIEKLRALIPISDREIANFNRDKKRTRRFNAIPIKTK